MFPNEAQKKLYRFRNRYTIPIIIKTNEFQQIAAYTSNSQKSMLIK